MPCNLKEIVSFEFFPFPTVWKRVSCPKRDREMIWKLFPTPSQAHLVIRLTSASISPMRVIIYNCSRCSASQNDWFTQRLEKNSHLNKCLLWCPYRSYLTGMDSKFWHMNHPKWWRIHTKHHEHKKSQALRRIFSAYSQPVFPNFGPQGDPNDTMLWHHACCHSQGRHCSFILPFTIHASQAQLSGGTFGGTVPKKPVCLPALLKDDFPKFLRVGYIL